MELHWRFQWTSWWMSLSPRFTQLHDSHVNLICLLQSVYHTVCALPGWHQQHKCTTIYYTNKLEHILEAIWVTSHVHYASSELIVSMEITARIGSLESKDQQTVSQLVTRGLLGKKPSESFQHLHFSQPTLDNFSLSVPAAFTVSKICTWF